MDDNGKKWEKKKIEIKDKEDTKHQEYTLRKCYTLLKDLDSH